MSPGLSLLTDPIVRVTAGDGGLQRLRLPEVLARLSGAQDLQFLALRPHQEASWHAFLVQLAYLALEPAGWPPLPEDAEGWQSLLRALTAPWPGDEPWCLVVDDWTRPAFMQASGPVQDYTGRCASAQELDLLVTSKNHDEKIGKLRGLEADDTDTWLYALVSLQGFAGYLGRGNFSTMRMNGGFASRPQFRLVLQPGSGAEFMRDVAALREHADELWHAAESLHIGMEDPLSLLWLEPWGEQALPLSRVHPLCLEVTRRVRLQTTPSGGLRACTAPSASMRVAAKDSKGHVLDPWTPLRLDGEVRALTAQADTFSYRSFAPLLFDDSFCRLPVLARFSAAEREALQPATLLAQVLVGGSGRTDGCLRREVHIPPQALPRIIDQRGELALRSRAFVDLAALAQGKVLRPALLQYVDGRAEVDWQNRDFDRIVSPWIEVLERRIDEVFFVMLFETESEPRMTDAQARLRWVHCLRALVRGVFAVAAASLPTRDRSRQLAQGRAERRLEFGLHQHLGDEARVEPTPAASPSARKTRVGRKSASDQAARA